MAIQLRRGAYNDLNINALLPGEVAVVLSGDPTTDSGKAIYICFGTGEVEKIALDGDLINIAGEGLSIDGNTVSFANSVHKVFRSNASALATDPQVSLLKNAFDHVKLYDLIAYCPDDITNHIRRLYIVEDMQGDSASFKCRLIKTDNNKWRKIAHLNKGTSGEANTLITPNDLSIPTGRYQKIKIMFYCKFENSGYLNLVTDGSDGRYYDYLFNTGTPTNSRVWEITIENIADYVGDEGFQLDNNTTYYTKGEAKATTYGWGPVTYYSAFGGRGVQNIKDIANLLLVHPAYTGHEGNNVYVDIYGMEL